MGLMGHIAERLDEEDLKAVAEYFASPVGGEGGRR